MGLLTSKLSRPHIIPIAYSHPVSPCIMNATICLATPAFPIMPARNKPVCHLPPHPMWIHGTLEIPCLQTRGHQARNRWSLWRDPLTECKKRAWPPNMKVAHWASTIAYHSPPDLRCFRTLHPDARTGSIIRHLPTPRRLAPSIR
jgi:hypothetical protein